MLARTAGPDHYWRVECGNAAGFAAALEQLADEATKSTVSRHVEKDYDALRQTSMTLGRQRHIISYHLESKRY